MKILIGTTELEVKECAPLRKPNGEVTLRITADKSRIGFDDFVTLLKENTADIQKLDDSGAVIDIYSGFHYSVKMSYDSAKETYTAEVVCQSEAEFQNGILKKQIAEQNILIEALQNTIEAQNTELLNTQLATCALYETIQSMSAATESEASEETENTETLESAETTGSAAEV